jgi:glycosyltransferase involved in cell wall biosynthesis
MRILFLATYFPDPENSARGNWALEQAQAFREAGDDVQVVVPTSWVPGILKLCGGKVGRYAGGARKWEIDGLTVDYPRWPYYPWQLFRVINNRHPSWPIRLAWLFLSRKLGSLVRSWKPDVVIAHHTLVSGQLAELMGREWGVPYVVTDHEIGDLLECGRNPAVREVFRRVAGGAKKMVMVSEAMRAEAAKHIEPGKLVTIHNGSSFPLYRRNGDRKEGEPLTVFSCAKFYGRKDIPLLIRAFDAVAGKFAVRLRIAGDGPEAGHVREAVAAARHRDRIDLIGLVDSETVGEEMRAADIFALVGWAEPFGVVFLEAMASGLPIVVCEDAGIAEALEDGETAVFTKPRDQASVEHALEVLLGDAGRRRRIATAGQTLFAERFRWSSVIAHYHSLLG